MDVAAFFRTSRVLVVAGKGGVGKTTITAALARMAAHAGLSVLVVELEGKPGVPAAFGRSGALAYDESLLAGFEPDDGSAPAPPGRGTVRARRITPDDALLEYLADHGMKRISRRLVSSGALDVVATAIPGLRDILVLGKVKSLEREPAADLILVDAPATGHAMTFLSSAQGLLDAARSGPVRTQAADVVEMLSDAERCQVVLVTLAEEMPVNEVVEAAYQLEDRIGISLGPVIVNACLPADPRLDRDAGEAAAEVGVTLTDAQADALRAAAAFRAHRFGLQEEQRGRLAAELPLPQLEAPFLFSSRIGPDELDDLAAGLATAVLALPDDAAAAARRHPSSQAARSGDDRAGADRTPDDGGGDGHPGGDGTGDGDGGGGDGSGGDGNPGPRGAGAHDEVPS
ncbi:MAG TPA: ArsA-related P-loop ATPase [Acidimicrobiales bacterium]|nr:ArsA-related P-loop ATPase [Acidimicrobiales bacterium]